MATRKPAKITAAAVAKFDTESTAAEDAAYEKAQQDSTIVTAAGVTNGMDAAEIRKRILGFVGGAVPLAEG